MKNVIMCGAFLCQTKGFLLRRINMLKIILAIILLPLLFEGIMFVLQIVLGGGMGIASLLHSIWDTQTKLTFKHGAIIGFIYAIALFCLNVIICIPFILFMHENILDFLVNMGRILNLLAGFIGIIALVRFKIAFGLSFLLIESITDYILFIVILKIFF